MYKLLFCFLLFPLLLAGQADHLFSVEDFVKHYPEQANKIFTSLDLNHPGLEVVKQSVKDQDLVEACQALLQYCQGSRFASFFPPVGPATDSITPGAATLLNDTYTFQAVTDQVPRLNNGRLDWNYTGPEDDIEWAWALNRHYPLRSLIAEYNAVPNPEYVRYMDAFVQDWIVSSWPYPAAKSSTAMWRGLEVSYRVKAWAEIFYRFIQTNLISDATRLLILASLPDHAHYAREFHAQNNWLTMEISGLATVAAHWPELNQASEWIDYTKETMLESMKEQVYPDGVQTELTSHYHITALSNFVQYHEICQRAGVSLPEYYEETIHDMYAYLAKTIRPTGYGILNNDGDLDYNRSRLLAAADKYEYPEWQSVVSHESAAAKTMGGTSFFFPWAGQLISRSGYDAYDQWSFFDIGPWGSGHQHNDKLHLSISAFGRDLLVDAGRFAYKGAVAEKFRPYARSSASHNTISINGKGQEAGPRLADMALDDLHYQIGSSFDYAWGEFDNFGSSQDYLHNRALFYLRDICWIVVDKIKAGAEKEVEAFWHFHPDCQVIRDGKGVRTFNALGNLSIIPLTDQDWDIAIIKGQEDPSIQGWYSEAYNLYEPNPCVSFKGSCPDNLIVWLITPYGTLPVDLDADIISTNDVGVSLSLTYAGQEYEIFVPFRNASLAQIKK